MDPWNLPHKKKELMHLCALALALRRIPGGKVVAHQGYIVCGLGVCAEALRLSPFWTLMVLQLAFHRLRLLFETPRVVHFAADSQSLPRPVSWLRGPLVSFERCSAALIHLQCSAAPERMLRFHQW